MGDLYFMPSDVARIVLGYLKESSYSKTYNCFLKECSHLKEIYNLEKAGRALRKVTQFNLCKILEEWGHHKYSSENSTIGGNNYIETPSSDETVDETLICDNDVTNSGRKAKARAGSSAKKSPQVLKGRRSPCTPKSSKLRFKSPKNNNYSYQQDAKETENIVCSSDKVITVHSNKENLNELTPKKSPFSVKRTDVSGKAVNNESSCLYRKDKGANVNDTAAEVPKAAKEGLDRSSENLEDGPKTFYPDGRKGNKDSEQSECVSKDNTKGQIHNKEKEMADKKYVSEPKHRKTDETSMQPTNETEIEEAGSAASKIMSEIFVKTIPESPCNSEANERCLAWLKKNDEVIKDTEHCDTNGNYDHPGLENLHVSENMKEPVQQQDNTQPVDGQLQAAHTDECSTDGQLQAAHTDECSNDVPTSKSSASTETVRSNSPVIAPGTSTSEQGTNLQHATQLPFHVTPKKMSPESRDKNLVTPIKLVQSSDHHTSRSPRRKKPKTPRKRTSEVSPVSVVSLKSVDPGSVNPIFEKILADHRLHEKLAETCNLVHSQIKLANSGKENKSDTRLGEQISPVPTSNSYDQETVTASQSLEEILGLDQNFHADMLSDNIDMSDPAYASLFKLFGTDRETFNEYLRKEKEKELALMEAEVEELERSNHEILCAIGVSNADAGYETQELAYSSPHHVALGSQDLFSTQHGSPCTLTTSTPCGNSVPGNFNAMLKGGLGNSPVHSSNVFGGIKTTGGMENKISPSSTATQPFSPAYSNYSEVNNPPTPRNQQNLYMNGNSPHGSNTPKSHYDDPYSNPNTPVQSNASQVMHSTPTGPGNPDHFHLSSPIHSQHSAVKNSHAPLHCSPLVKADIHLHSPLLTRTNGYHSDNNNGLYFHSQMSNEATNQNGNVNSDNMIYDTGYLNLLQNGVNNPDREPCTTIENTIGCLSLPQPQKIETKHNDKKKGTSRSRRKREPVKRKNVSASHATVKSLLEKPLKHLNRFPLSMKIGDLQQVCRTPDKRPPENLTFRSPGGKTMINVPILNCEDQIDLSVLGMDENEDVTASTISVYDQKLDSSTQYSIAPENQATHQLMSAIEAGKTLEVVQQINKCHSDEAKQKTSKRSNTERKTRARKKKEEVTKEEQKEHFSPTPPSSGGFEEGQLDPNQEVYTATPFTSLHKAATVRALNFGPNVDDPNIAHFRKIYPKLQATDNSPSVLILNTNQVISPGHNVIVNSTPVTLVQNMPKTSNVIVDAKNNNIKDKSSKESSDIGQVEGVALHSDKQASTKRVTISESVRQSQDTTKYSDKLDTEKKCDTETKSNENAPKKVQIKSPEQLKNVSETPKKSSQIPKQSRNLSTEMAEESLEKSKSEEENSVKKEKSDIKNEPEAIVTCSLESKVQPEEDKIKNVKEAVKCKKVDNPSKTSKSKSNKVKEKLKVKIPVISHKSPKGKKLESKPVKTGIPFYFKKKNVTTPENDNYSSDEDVPLSVLRNQKRKGKVDKKSIDLVVESESTDDEGTGGNVIPAQSNSKETCEEIENTSKELLFEKIGLTPTKSLSKYDLKSPNRANALDVMAEWQRSPLSSRSRGLTPNTRNRFSKFDDVLKSPTTPKRKTHAKQLFASPEKKVTENVIGGKEKQTAKRVEKIIDRLKQNNPGRNLDSVKRNKNKKNSRNDKKSSEVNDNFADSGNETEKVTTNKKIKEKKSLKKEQYKLLKSPVNEEVFENRDENNLKDDKFIGEEDLNNSVIENINEEAETGDDENSQSASELHRAVASIEFDHAHVQHEDEQIVQVHQYNQDHLNDIYPYSKYEEPVNNSDSAKEEFTETANTYNTENMTGQSYHSPEKLTKGQSDPESVIRHEQVVVAEVHHSLNDQDSNELKEEFQNSRNNLVMVNEQTDGNLQNTCKASVVPEIDQLDSETQNFDNVDIAHDQFKVDNVNSEHDKRKSKKKKRKHRHCHRHSKGSGNEMSNVGDQFLSPGEPVEEHHRHSHKKKKKKSKKRHREESEDGHESKRRRKEKKSVSLDSLAALNVDEALTQIYGQHSSDAGSI